MSKFQRKIIILAGIIALVGVIKYFGWDHYFTLENLKAQKGQLLAYYQKDPLTFSALFFVLYIVVAALAIPLAAVILTLAAGAVLGVPFGFLLVSFGSTIGATLAFLASRYLFKDVIESRFSDKLELINNGLKQDGLYYLFTLRLIPLFPFFLINVVMGLTALPGITFYWVSQVGMIPGTLVYLYAGSELGKVSSVGDVMSPGLWGAFALVGLFPWMVKGVKSTLERWKHLRPWADERPKQCDYHMIVVGAGAAGLSAAAVGAALKGKVLLVEEKEMGGDCLNTGCVPSKALLKSARVASLMKNRSQYGLEGELSFDDEKNFEKVMERVHEKIRAIAPHDSVERFEGLGVECVAGKATLTNPWTVEVAGKSYTGKNILLAMGAEPWVPGFFEGLEQIDYLTSDTIWSLKELPQRFLVIGGGAIGIELGQAFQRLGSQVTMVNKTTRLLNGTDAEVSSFMEERLRSEGIDLHLGFENIKFHSDELGSSMELLCVDGKTHTVYFDKVLLALGRRPRTDEKKFGLGLKALGIDLTSDGRIKVGKNLRTPKFSHILAAGDVAGPFKLTHMAGHQGSLAAINALFGPLVNLKVNHKVVPRAIYCDPEVAFVGLTEHEAQAKKIPHEVTRYGIDDLDRAIADSAAYGFVRVLTKPGTDKILGATIVAQGASDILAEFTLAMQSGLGLTKIMNTIHPYPSMSEANRFLAIQWKKNHTAPMVFKILEKLNGWRL